MKRRCPSFLFLIFLGIFFAKISWAGELPNVYKVQKYTSKFSLKKGIFFKEKTTPKKEFTLERIRSYYNEKEKSERIVFDFLGNGVPSLYGYLEDQKLKIFIDFYQTKASKKLKIKGKSRFSEEFNLVSLGDKMISLEIKLKDPIVSRVFYLREKPGRLVIDMRRIETSVKKN